MVLNQLGSYNSEKTSYLSIPASNSPREKYVEREIMSKDRQVEGVQRYGGLWVDPEIGQTGGVGMSISQPMKKAFNSIKQMQCHLDF